jgi:hypothetical protein
LAASRASQKCPEEEEEEEARKLVSLATAIEQEEDAE